MLIELFGFYKKLSFNSRGKLLQLSGRKANSSQTSIDQSSEIPPCVEGYKDVIDDEAVSLSFHMQLFSCVRTSDTFSGFTTSYILSRKESVCSVALLLNLLLNTKVC